MESPGPSNNERKGITGYRPTCGIASQGGVNPAKGAINEFISWGEKLQLKAQEAGTTVKAGLAERRHCTMLAARMHPCPDAMIKTRQRGELISVPAAAAGCPRQSVKVDQQPPLLPAENLAFAAGEVVGTPGPRSGRQPSAVSNFTSALGIYATIDGRVPLGRWLPPWNTG